MSSLGSLSVASLITCDASVNETLFDPTAEEKDGMLEYEDSARTFDVSLRSVPLIQHCLKLRLKSSSVIYPAGPRWVLDLCERQ